MLPPPPRSSPVLLHGLPPGDDRLGRFVCGGIYIYIYMSSPLFFEFRSFFFVNSAAFIFILSVFLGAFVPSLRPGSARVRAELQRHSGPDEYSAGVWGVQEMAVQLVVRQVRIE